MKRCCELDPPVVTELDVEVAKIAMADSRRAQRAAAFVVPLGAESGDEAWDLAQAAREDAADSDYGKRKRPRRIRRVNPAPSSSSGDGSRSRPAQAAARAAARAAAQAAARAAAQEAAQAASPDQALWAAYNESDYADPAPEPTVASGRIAEERRAVTQHTGWLRARCTSGELTSLPQAQLDEFREALVQAISTIDKFETAQEAAAVAACKGCYTNRVDRVLRCGHVFCHVCVARVLVCPLCRLDINATGVSRLFL